MPAGFRALRFPPRRKRITRGEIPAGNDSANAEHNWFGRLRRVISHGRQRVSRILSRRPPANKRDDWKVRELRPAAARFSARAFLAFSNSTAPPLAWLRFWLCRLSLKLPNAWPPFTGPLDNKVRGALSRGFRLVSTNPGRRKFFSEGKGFRFARRF